MKRAAADFGNPERMEHLLSGPPPVREVIVPAPDAGMKWHCHDYPDPLASWNHHPEFELHLIRNASGRFVVGDAVGEFFPGNLCLIGPWLPHQWISSVARGEKIHRRDVVLQFDGAALTRALRYLPEAEALTRLFVRARRGIEFKGRTRARAATLLLAMEEQKGMARLSVFFQIFSLLAQAPKADVCLLASSFFQPSSDPEAAPVMDKVLDYIVGHHTRPLRLEKVARMAGMKPAAFSRFFKKVSGRGFAETVRTLRVVHACGLLRESSRSISEICFASGYENLSNFNRRFREETGMTPSLYRARHATGLTG